MKRYFIFYAKLFGYWHELNADNETINKKSLIAPARKKANFIKNAKKAYPKTQLFFNQVGNY